MPNNKANMFLKSGIIYRATNWDGTVFSTGNGTNEDEILAQLEALSFSDVGLFTDASIMHSPEDIKILETDYCSVGEFGRSMTLTPRIEYTWQETGDMDTVAAFLGLDTQSVAGSLVSGASQVKAANSFTYNTGFRISNKNANGTTVTVTSITGSTDGLLVANTDYFVGLDSDGYTTITVIDSATVTTLNQTLTIIHSYTPAASKLLTYKVEQRDVPYSLVKFVTCPNEAGEFDVFYLIKVFPSAELQQQFVNQKRTDFSGTGVTLTGALGGNYFWKKGSLTSF